MANCRYEKWNAKVDTLECLPWYNCRELATTIKAIRRINYSNEKERRGALESLNKISDVAPFTRLQRFSDGFYIMESNGDLGKKMQKLRDMLELSDSKAAKGRLLPPMAERITNFRRYCTYILGELAKGEEVFDRKRFEQFFNVVWAKHREKEEQPVVDAIFESKKRKRYFRRY